MKINILLIFFLLFSHNILTAQGLIFNEKTDLEYKNIPSKNTSLSADYVIMPKVVDLSKYLPSIINQKELGTCVGVSSAYYMRTILEAQRLGITDKNKIDQLKFSPSYLYNAVKDSTNLDCMKGVEINKTLSFLKNNGVALYNQLPYHVCEKNDPNIKPAANSKIMDFIKVFGANDNIYQDPVSLTKKAIAENSPVLVGFYTSDSFDDLKFFESILFRIWAFFGLELSEENDFRLWKLENGEKLGSGHCVCIVGYNDNMYGGAFRIVNSYGETWGDNGFCWIKYTDFPKLAKYCFQAYLEPEINATESELTASIIIRNPDSSVDNAVPYFRNFSQSTKDTINQICTYSLLNIQSTGSEYIHEANIAKQCYLYLIGKNEASPVTPLLFPNADSTSELIGQNSKFIFPSPKWNTTKTGPQEQTYKLVDPLGQENWLFLFSKKKLNIAAYMAKIDNGTGPFTKRVIAAFGSDLVPYHQINYSNKKLSFDLKKGHTGYIVPVLITFDHFEQVQ